MVVDRSTYPAVSAVSLSKRMSLLNGFESRKMCLRSDGEAAIASFQILWTRRFRTTSAGGRCSRMFSRSSAVLMTCQRALLAESLAIILMLVHADLGRVFRTRLVRQRIMIGESGNKRRPQSRSLPQARAPTQAALINDNDFPYVIKKNSPNQNG